MKLICRSFVWLILLALTFCFPAYSRGSRSGYHVGHSRTHRSKNDCYTCARNKEGRIKRSSHAKHEFVKTHPCPSTGKSSGPCPGYVIDHVRPLKRGGADDPNNMQWQTVQEAKAKDRVE